MHVCVCVCVSVRADSMEFPDSLSRHQSLSSITPSTFSRQHLVSVQN